jgi:hypothetical protein
MAKTKYDHQLSELGEAAQAYAKMGLPIFPLQPGEKIPFQKSKGFKDATTDLIILRRYWLKHPEANIGMPTGTASGIWVLDVDLPSGPQNLEILQLKKEELPSTLCIRTGGGGIQYLFKWNGDNIRNSTNKISQHLDIRGEGGYVLLPPSKTTGTYVWEW